MELQIMKSSREAGKKGAEKAEELIRKLIEEQGEFRMLIPTGQSQFEFYEAFTKMDLPWDKMEFFHLDEYVGLPMSHPASFRKYLKERVVDVIGIKRIHYIDGEGDLESMITNLTEKITEKTIDIGIIGIGENGHIAFNDPPADFDTQESYKVVELDERCRRQQVGEGWFASVDDVPKLAISATVSQIMKCRYIVSVVPHKVKAEAVKKTLETAGVTEYIPATKLKEHENWYLYLDENSASELMISCSDTSGVCFTKCAEFPG